MIVVDAALVVDVMTRAPDTEVLRSELADVDLHAPALLDYEVVSALRGQVRSGNVTAARAQTALEDLDDLTVLRWSATRSLRRRAFALRDSISAYDAAYVALAEALDCPLLTRDARLARSHGHAARIVVR